MDRMHNSQGWFGTPIWKNFRTFYNTFTIYRSPRANLHPWLDGGCQGSRPMARPIAGSALADFPQNGRRQRAQPNQSDESSHREIRESPLFPGWLTGLIESRCTGL
jgi:hypothetical protein